MKKWIRRAGARRAALAEWVLQRLARTVRQQADHQRAEAWCQTMPLHGYPPIPRVGTYNSPPGTSAHNPGLPWRMGRPL